MWGGGGLKKPFYISNKNVLCGGAVYSGIGNKKMIKEDFDAGMGTTLGPKKAYATRQVMRRVNQQIPHVYKHHKYLVIGRFEDVADPDVIMIVADANLDHAPDESLYLETGETGAAALSGTAW